MMNGRENIDGSCMALMVHPTGDPHLVAYCTRPEGHDGKHHSELKQQTWED